MAEFSMGRPLDESDLHNVNNRGFGAGTAAREARVMRPVFAYVEKQVGP
jgi:hypothetical protein